VPFDAARQRLTGTPVAVIEGVRRSLSTNISQFSIADNGTLIYIPGPAGNADIRKTELVSMTLKGEVTRLALPDGPSYNFPRYSPDGTQVAFEAQDSTGTDVWIYDLSGYSAMRRLTFGGHNRHPIWTRDGKRITFQSDREDDLGLFSQRADGTGAVERLTKAEKGTAHVPQSWSPKSDRLLFTANTGGVLGARTGANNPGSHSTLLLLSIAPLRTEPFAGIESRDRAVNAEFSPDGAWVAYSTGVAPSVVYVRPFPATSAVYQISKNDDGHHPWWSHDGRTLYYVPGPDGLSRVTVATSPAFSFSNPGALPRGLLSESPVTSRSIDTNADDTRLIGAAQVNAAAGTPRIQVVLNWFDELRRLAPAAR
jgi:dipeptidyl aminopeptidase/acylaminoacyl peptidase